MRIASGDASEVAAVGAEAGNRELLSAIEIEFLGNHSVIFAAFGAGQEFFGDAVGNIADVVGRYERCGLVLFWVGIFPGKAALGGLFFRKGEVIKCERFVVAERTGFKRKKFPPFTRTPHMCDDFLD